MRAHKRPGLMQDLQRRRSAAWSYRNKWSNMQHRLGHGRLWPNGQQNWSGLRNDRLLGRLMTHMADGARRFSSF